MKTCTGYSQNNIDSLVCEVLFPSCGHMICMSASINPFFKPNTTFLYNKICQENKPCEIDCIGRYGVNKGVIWIGVL